MNLFFNDLNINIDIDDVSFSIVNISYEHFFNVVPLHSHGHNSYELHYVSEGSGILKANGTTYKLVPHTFYVIAPHVEHEQIPFSNTSLVEYNIFFKIDQVRSTSDFLNTFLETRFWIGSGVDKMDFLLKSIKEELRNKKPGYLLKVESCIQLYIVLITRNIIYSKSHSTPPPPKILNFLKNQKVER